MARDEKPTKISENFNRFEALAQEIEELASTVGMSFVVDSNKAERFKRAFANEE